MKYFIAAMLFCFTTVVTASDQYMMICRGSGLTLSLKRELKYDGSINGWKNYWAQVDYLISAKSGTLEAQISWRQDSRPGYNALIITLMDKAEAAFRKEGIEGGSVGFGEIDSREEIKSSFNAKWSTYKVSEDAPELQSNGVELKCEIMGQLKTDDLVN